MPQFKIPDSWKPSEILWIIEYLRQPDDDEGVQTLFGPFKNADDAIACGKKEFNKGEWRIRSLHTVKLAP